MADKEEKDDQLKIVGPGADEEPSNGETPDTESTNEEEVDTRLGHSESEDDEDDEEDSSSPNWKPYHEMNAEEKRQWRKDKKNRRQKARQRDQTELNFLRQRNENLERRFSQLETRTVQTEVLGIDQRISQLKSQVAVADQVIAKGIDSQAGSEVVEAQQIREELLGNIRRLEQMKSQVSSTEEATTTAQRSRPTVPKIVVDLANQFKSRHPWFQLGKDEDSDIVSALDNRVSADGFDPSSPEYWDELEDRMRKRLPHRFKKSKTTEEEDPPPVTKKRNGGPTFSTGGREHRPLKKGEVFVSEERKKAMLEAGVWDDPVLRNKYLKAYQKYDQENVSRNRA